MTVAPPHLRRSRKGIAWVGLGLRVGVGLGLDSILDYFDPDQARLTETYTELASLFPEGKDPADDDGASSAGSDDNPDEDCADPAAMEKALHNSNPTPPNPSPNLTLTLTLTLTRQGPGR